jgi:UDP-glucose 4-epimerase
VTVNHVLDLLGKIMGRPLEVNRVERQHGDVTHTYADTSRAQADMGFKPRVTIEEGLRKEYEWFLANQDLLL